MAKKQGTRKLLKAEPVPVPAPTSDSEPDLALEEEEEFHTDPEDADEDEELDDPEDAEDGEEIEYHTEPEDEDSPPTKSNPPLLPAELLKSKPSEAPATVQVPWKKLTRAERKALRDERGISMQKLRAEAPKSGVLEAGLAAQIKRGVRPADKVAGGRIAKRKSKRKAAKKAEMSGKQQLLEQRKTQSGKGRMKPVTRRKG